jgi:glycosyltransferase involved in cell wall biosynthesis
VTRTIGLVFPGDSSAPTTWSGIPFGLAGGFEDLGLEVVHLRAAAPRRVERALGAAIAVRHVPRARQLGVSPARSGARTAARMGPTNAALRSTVAAAAVGRAGDVDAFVQIGTGYMLPTRRPVVTCEDMTIPQAIRHRGYTGWKIMAPRGRQARMAIARRSYRRAVACGGLSDWVVHSIVEDYGIPAEKVHTMGIGANRLPAPRPRDWATPRLLWVGLDWERKRGDAVVRAFGALREQRPGATLDLVGRHPRVDVPGVTGHGLLRLGDPEGAAKLDELFGRATCFVMPSRVEPVGIVYAEALHAGIPSVGTTQGGSPLVIGDAGATVHPDDEPGLLDALLQVTDPQRAPELGERALARSPLFRWRAVAERYLRALGHEEWEGRPLADYLD